MRYTKHFRSMLFTPATAVDRYRRCHQSSADICVVDLEDSVAAADKEIARRDAAMFFSAPSAAARRCAVRVNAVTEPDGLRDLVALLDYEVRPNIVVVPKAESARDVEIVEQVLGGGRADLEICAVIETPRGLENALSIAEASESLRALIFGAADYSFAVGARRTWECLLSARARVVNSARAANIEAVDSPVFEFADLDALRWEAPLSKDLGFSGKAAIHPGQVPVINDAFSPDADVLALAQRIVTAGKANGRAVTSVDGVMAGRPFFDAAQRLLDEFEPPAESASRSAGKGEAWA
ncbi:citrate lyase subunit beta / citryl-CoA lyase/(S)-citramalyl-CoA lyase [Lentzea xinjiangensis]|uniref:Citrate lyase subunit beta / citryl-CoA lyase/(S)-citramalyl-CoA lyase n=1 Tax=Lentzea xinjiangensis TaxID=402600 RepID=A0A1H9SZ55_9PSEU|nr:CoA ester lyase [Lentzea xinjiangensis]SER90074.1 citrate lyase subunit beta / citryl-CoA lyase/(S)-citramalyl-CoA lyase [Lentzea xinjiangensis]